MKIEGKKRDLHKYNDQYKKIKQKINKIKTKE